MSINGVVDYWHLPYGEEGAFTYCNHCKKTCERVNVEFHEGWTNDWMVLRCSKCKKSIWTSNLHRKQTKDNKKCDICKKPTNWIDCNTSGGRLGEKGMKYWCSKKCYKKSNELFFKENEVIDELDLCAEEQKIDLDFEIKLNLVRKILNVSN